MPSPSTRKVKFGCFADTTSPREEISAPALDTAVKPFPLEDVVTNALQGLAEPDFFDSNTAPLVQEEPQSPDDCGFQGMDNRNSIADAHSYGTSRVAGIDRRRRLQEKLRSCLMIE